MNLTMPVLRALVRMGAVYFCMLGFHTGQPTIYRIACLFWAFMLFVMSDSIRTQRRPGKENPGIRDK